MNDVEDIKRVLPVKLTSEEKEAQTILLTSAIEDIDKIEDEKKEAAATYKDALDDKWVEIGRIKNILKRGAEDRPVLCRWVEDFTHNVKRLVRQDTGDTVEEVTMTSTDRQLAMKELEEPEEVDPDDYDDEPEGARADFHS